MAEKTNLIAQHSGRFVVAYTYDVGPGLDVPPGTRILQEPGYGGELGGFYKLTRRESGGFSFVAKHSGKAIDVARASQDVGAQLIQWDYHGGPNQRFRL